MVPVSETIHSLGKLLNMVQEARGLAVNKVAHFPAKFAMDES